MSPKNKRTKEEEKTKCYSELSWYLRYCIAIHVTIVAENATDHFVPKFEIISSRCVVQFFLLEAYVFYVMITTEHEVNKDNGKWQWKRWRNERRNLLVKRSKSSRLRRARGGGEIVVSYGGGTWDDCGFQTIQTTGRLSLHCVCDWPFNGRCA